MDTTTGKENMVTHTPASLLEVYFDALQSRVFDKEFKLEGHYQDKGGQQYYGYYYDQIALENEKITVRIPSSLKAVLTNGRYYQIQGTLGHSKPKDSNISVVFKVLSVELQNKFVPAMSEEIYELVKDKFDTGFVNVEQRMQEELTHNLKPSVLIITGKESIAINDVYAQIDADILDRFYIAVEKVNLSSTKEILKLLDEKPLHGYNYIAFVRGGGSGLEIFEDQELCQKVLQTGKILITAIGHANDRPLLEKLADKSFSTPTAFGEFCNKIISRADHLIQEREYRNEVIGDLNETRQQLNTLKSQFVKSQTANKKIKGYLILSIILMLILLYIQSRMR